MNKDEAASGVSISGYKGEEGPPDDLPAEDVKTDAMPDARGKPAEAGDGAARGSGQSTGHGNPGEEPDNDAPGGDGTAIQGLKKKRS